MFIFMLIASFGWDDKVKSVRHASRHTSALISLHSKLISKKNCHLQLDTLYGSQQEITFCSARSKLNHIVEFIVQTCCFCIETDPESTLICKQQMGPITAAYHSPFLQHS